MPTIFLSEILSGIPLRTFLMITLEIPPVIPLGISPRIPSRIRPGIISKKI